MKTSLFTQIIHFLLILFFTSENLYALLCEEISIINGLTNNSVNCMLEDCENTDVDRNMGWTECVQWERNHNV